MAYAAESGDYLILNLLFIRLFDINHRMDGNQTALMKSAANGRFDAVLWLIDNGADSTIGDNNQRTAANLASDARHEAVASLLEHHSTPKWESIKDLRDLIIELRTDADFNELSEYESLLKTKKFETLRSLRIDYLLLPEDELFWFRATENCSIGLEQSGSLIWMINKRRERN